MESRILRRYFAVILFTLFLYSPCFAEINVDWLRHDETLTFDEIRIKFDDYCQPSQISGEDTRTLSIAIDTIKFLDINRNSLFSIDVGGRESSYYLGKGWYGNEDWGGLTASWTNGSADSTKIYCHIPDNSRYIEIVCSTACKPINSEIFINDKRFDRFSLPANSGMKTITLPLPDNLGRYVEYRLRDGGPLQIKQIDWINSYGQVTATDATSCELIKAGDSVRFPVQIPENTGDLAIKLSKPAPNKSSLQVSVNNVSAMLLEIPAGLDYIDSTVKDALQRQADIKTQTSGWGEDFSARNSFAVTTSPCSQYPSVTYDGGTVSLSMPDGCSLMFVRLTLAKPLLLSEYLYLAVKLKISKGDMYYIRPYGYDANGREVPIWYEEAVTDDRIGTGEWETYTFNIQTIAELSGTKAVSVSYVEFPLLKNSKDPDGASIEFDWVRIHKGLPPNKEDIKSQETVFNNNLDDDNDGLVDRDDKADFMGKGFSQPLVLAYYHPWFGTPFSSTHQWSGWNGQRMDYSEPNSVPKDMGITYNPNNFDPNYAGKRILSCPYYPLNFWDYPDYVPPADNKYRYDIYGGVEEYDNLSEKYVRKEIALASKYGIDGFIINTGGRGSFEGQIRTALNSVEDQKRPFWLTLIYDWYYMLPEFVLMGEKSDVDIAQDLIYMSSNYGEHPNFLRYDDRPAIFASFLSTLIAPEKWLRIKELTLNPEGIDIGIFVDIVENKAGFGNKIDFSFLKAEQPSGGDKRYLSIAFDYIQFLDKNLKPISIFDFGSPEARQHLLYGWSGDENWGDKTMVWAEGTAKKAGLEIQIPSQAVFMEIACVSFPENNSVTMTINNGKPIEFAVPKTQKSFLFRITEKTDPSKIPAKSDKPPYALFLDSKTAAQYYDGYASYGPSIGGSLGLVSDSSPRIVTIWPGYDDKKIRYPGSYTDRENGALYRRQWESALKAEPDVVLITTWSEWAEGTVIAPTVEFGYKYLELTLTYSLIFQKKMSVSLKPSELELTINRYEIDDQGNCNIKLSAEKQGTVLFYGLPISLESSSEWQVLKDNQPYKAFTVSLKDQTLSLTLQDSKSVYQIQGKVVSSGSSCIKGDVDGDGKINAKDALLTMRIGIGLITPTSYQSCSADVNNDGKINAGDAIAILRISAGLSAPADDRLIADQAVTIKLDEIYEANGNNIIAGIRCDKIDKIVGGDMVIAYEGSVKSIEAVSDGCLLASRIDNGGIVHISFVLTDKPKDDCLIFIRFDTIRDDKPILIKSAQLYGSNGLMVKSKIVDRGYNNAIPRQTALLQNYPNPFNPDTWIPYQLKDGGEVVISIYNSIGKLIRCINLGYKSAGIYSSRDRAVYWDGKDESGETVSSGTYFYLIQTGKYKAIKKMAVLR